jgi:hypothetical protein
MFSKKNLEDNSGFSYTVPEGDPIPDNGRWRPTHKLSGEAIVGTMDRGVPFMLIEDPEFVSFKVKVLSRIKKGKTKRVWKTVVERRWKLRILHEQKIYHMYLTKRQHDAMLVKAVLRRMNKNYGSKANSRD